MTRTSRQLWTVLSLGIILTVVGLDWLIFRAFHGSYFLWFLKYGPVISLAAGFLAPVWTAMKERLGLISANPMVYVAACLQLSGVFLVSLGSTNKDKTAQPKELGIDIGLNGTLVTVFDNLTYSVLMLVMAALSISWVIFVAPLAYFVTLIAGVPARESLRGRIGRTYIEEEQGKVTIIESQNGQQLPREAVEISFARDPFTITQATTALVIWVANFIYARIG